ncbi:MAG TPA: hypothetical protein VKA27_06530 [Sunxiuqinia sp.]|nr:hypothetical protein [Sunxiuqinia sp.]
MKKYKIFFLVAVIGLLASACKYDYIVPETVVIPDNGGNPISFSEQIMPIFSNGDQCTKCHKQGGFGTPDFTKSAAVVYSSIVPAYVDTTNPEGSTIYINAHSGSHNNAKVSGTEAALLLQWITEGAQNN